MTLREQQETEKAVQEVQDADPDTAAFMEALVAGVPTQDTEQFKALVETTGKLEEAIHADGNCFWAALKRGYDATRCRNRAETVKEFKERVLGSAVASGSMNERTRRVHGGVA